MKALSGVVLGSLGFAALSGAFAVAPAVSLTPISTLEASVSGTSAAEIPAYDPDSQRLFVVNAAAAKIDVFSIENPRKPRYLRSIDVTAYGAVANSVAVKNGIVAVAVEADPKTSPGKVAFFKAGNLEPLSAVTVGSQPDMLTFTPDGRYVLTANEGEPANAVLNPDNTVTYPIDPDGSVSIIEVSASVRKVKQTHVRTISFTGFNSYERAQLFAMDNIRVFGPAGTVAQNIEPEYLTISADSTTAWVTLQENNALAKIDIASGTVSAVTGLGTKDHSIPGNGFDASDRDSAIKIQPWPVSGLYLPDAIASYVVDGETYLLLANEGDAREWGAYDEQVRISALTLDPTAFPDAAALKNNANLGRLRVTSAQGDIDGDGDYDRLFAYGARSFSIRNAAGGLVWDSGDQLEQVTASRYPANFNASNDANTFDARSPSKGPEPEGITVGTAFGRTFAFIGLERIGGVAVYDVSDPHAPFFATYANNRDFSKPVTDSASGDLGPEGLIFVSADQSPNGRPLVVVANEISGTTTIYELSSE